MYTSTHKWHKPFDLLALGKGQFKRKIYTNRLQNLANFEHTACWVRNIYPEIGDQLVKSIKKVNWNTAVRIPYHHIFFYIDTYKGLPRPTKLMLFYVWMSVFQRKVSQLT